MKSPDDNFKVVLVAAMAADSSGVTISCVKPGELSLEEALDMAINFARHLADGHHVSIEKFIEAIQMNLHLYEDAAKPKIHQVM